MVKKTGYDKPGIKTKKRPHLGDLLLARYEKQIKSGFDDLERFELIDRLKKPVLYFAFSGTKRLIIDLHDCLSQFPYSFFIRTNKGLDIWNLPELGTRNAHVHISRFPNLIKFIQDNENSISSDMWGLLYGYPVPDIHQFTYAWDAWKKAQPNE
jgi:hypothetical protein